MKIWAKKIANRILFKHGLEISKKEPSLLNCNPKVMALLFGGSTLTNTVCRMSIREH